MTYFLMRASESREVGGSSGEKTRCCLQCIIFRYVSNEREREQDTWYVVEMKNANLHAHTYSNIFLANIQHKNCAP